MINKDNNILEKKIYELIGIVNYFIFKYIEKVNSFNLSKLVII